MTRRDKILLAAGVAAAAGLFFWGWSCHSAQVKRSAGSDTVVTVSKTDTIYRPHPVKIIKDSIQYVPVTLHDTLEMPGEVEIRIDPADTAAILADYNATRFYADTQTLARGKVIIADSVTRNRITSRRLQTEGTDTIITNTTVLQQPKKLILYFGLQAFGQRKDPFHAAGIDLSLKGFNDRQYGLEMIVDKNGEIYYGVIYKVPIRLPIKRKP